MLIRQGVDRNERIDRQLAMSLAGTAGALNAAAFYAVGFFAANMTGNVSLLSDHIALGAWMSGFFYLFVVLVFILGAGMATVAINAGLRRHISAIYAYCILAEAVLLAILGVTDLWLLPTFRAPVLVSGLAFLMGLQNAVVTRISNSRVRATHVSGMATDIGIELGIALDSARGRVHDKETVQNRSKLLLHVYTVLAFLIGGVAGVLVYRAAGGVLLLVAAVLLVAIAFSGIADVRRQQRHTR